MGWGATVGCRTARPALAVAGFCTDNAISTVQGLTFFFDPGRRPRGCTGRHTRTASVTGVQPRAIVTVTLARALSPLTASFFLQRLRRGGPAAGPARAGATCALAAVGSRPSRDVRVPHMLFCGDVSRDSVPHVREGDVRALPGARHERGRWSLPLLPAPTGAPARRRGASACAATPFVFGGRFSSAAVSSAGAAARRSRRGARRV